MVGYSSLRIGVFNFNAMRLSYEKALNESHHIVISKTDFVDFDEDYFLLIVNTITREIVCEVRVDLNTIITVSKLIQHLTQAEFPRINE